MKTLLSSFSLFAISLISFAQCEIVAVVTQNSVQSCFDEPVLFLGYGSTDCPEPYTINYTWTAYISNGTEMIAVEEESGNAPSLTNIPIYSWANWATVSQVCLTLTIIDESQTEIATTTACSENIFTSPPLAITAVAASNDCGEMSCFNLFATGGTMPYTFDYGNGAVGNGYFCTEFPGTYFVSVIDANGCFASTSVEVLPSETGNVNCTQAIILQDEMITSDTLCGISQQTIDCGGIANYYQHGWYMINSGNSTVLNLGINSGYYQNSSPNNMMGVEVFAVPSGGDCTAGELVFCQTGFNCGSLDVMPNMDYYIHVLTMWTSWAPMQILVELSDEPLEGMCGCTTANSCNYDPAALIDDGTCGYNGCMDSGACNYLSYATCDDGSCVFGSDLTGLIFHDVNGDGIRSTWPQMEPVLGNTGYITVEELGIDIYANASGEFLLPSTSSGLYHVNFTDPNGAWILSSEGPLEITLPTCNGLIIPLIPSTEVTAQIYGTGQWWNPTMHCTNGLSLGVWVTNTGNVPLNGTVTMSYDESLSIIGTLPGYVAPSSNSNGLLTWVINNQAPGTLLYYMVHFNGPGVSFVGSVFSFNSAITLSNDGVPFYNEEWTTNSVVTCAYDPNDKQAIPAGYTEEHFILADEEIEYRIRFQNTGNAPAFNVHIDDQIDISKLDMSSFVPVAASHSYSTIVNPDGLVRFVFDNIMLPDSVNNEPESHGFVVYRIRPVAGLQAGDVIENTAAIYFDENPAVITNTYRHTVFECSMIDLVDVPMDVCETMDIISNAFSPYVETYQWYLDGELEYEGNPLVLESLSEGEYEISVIRSNPLCEVEEIFTVNVWPLPGDEITVDGSTLTAPDGASWLWYQNGITLPEQTNQTFEVAEEGSYMVETVSEHGCTTMSNEVLIIGVEELEFNSSSIYPNPASDQIQIALPLGIWEIAFYNSVGEKVLHLYNKQGRIFENITSLASGLYSVRITNDEGLNKSLPLVIR